MENRVVLEACGKINLSLSITGRRADGYHTLHSVMQSISLSNRVAVETTRSGLSFSCNDKNLPTDEKNTAVRAALAYQRKTAWESGLLITIQKRIPYQAGLGSASADAAGVLAALNALCPTPLSSEALLALAATIGADVPFCLSGGTMLAEGIGEALSPLPTMPDCFLVIVRPSVGVSTPEAYRAFDLAYPSCKKLPNDSILFALSTQTLPAIAAALSNDFRTVVSLEAVDALRTQLRALGALGAEMSGSGSAVYGIFSSKALAQKALEALRGEDRLCYLAKPTQVGILFAQNELKARLF